MKNMPCIHAIKMLMCACLMDTLKITFDTESATKKIGNVEF